MEIRLFNVGDISSMAGTSAGKYTLSVNSFIPNATATTTGVTTTTWTGYISAADGSLSRGLTVGGNNSPIMDVQPKYFPVATKGAECGAIVTSLSWADSNLSQYEFIQYGATAFFVTGVLNSSQTQANDPFNPADAPGITSGACWAGVYSTGLQPF